MRTIITSHLLLTVRMHGMLMVTRWRHLTPPNLLLTNQPKLTLTVTLTLTDTLGHSNGNIFMRISLTPIKGCVTLIKGIFFA